MDVSPSGQQLLSGGHEPTFTVPKGKTARLIDIAQETVDLLKAHKAHQAALKMRNRTRYHDHSLVFAKEWSDVGRKRDVLGDPVDNRRVQTKKGPEYRTFLCSGAEGGIRTPTFLRTPAPQAGASASSATSARRASRSIPVRRSPGLKTRRYIISARAATRAAASQASRATASSQASPAATRARSRASARARCRRPIPSPDGRSRPARAHRS
jgi:hypothetical protein